MTAADRPQRADEGRFASPAIIVLTGVATCFVAVGGLVTGVAAFAIVGIAIAAIWLYRGIDVVNALTIWLAAMAIIPASIVLESLKSVGAPAFLISIGLASWWGASRLTRSIGGDRGRQPLRAPLMLWLGATTASAGVAFTQPLLGVQRNGAVRSVLFTLGYVGLALLAADGVPSMARLETLVRRVVLAAGYVAFVAVLQFQRIADLALIPFPGLVANREMVIRARSGFDRVLGTASHPIEAGVVVGIVFPLALHLLTHGRTRGDRRIGGVVSILLVLTMAMTVSRTAPIVVAVGVLVLGFTWPKDLRRRAVVVGAVSLVAIRALFPGLLGTVRALFEHVGDDPSVSGRTQDYGLVFPLFDENPVLGIGPGTFLPDVYIFLDNQFLGTAIEMGVVGLIALAGLVITTVALGVAARRRLVGRVERDLAQALIASVVAGLVSFATFDALGFPMFAGFWFLMIGMIGAIWRLSYAEPGEADGPEVGELPTSTAGTSR